MSEEIDQTSPLDLEVVESMTDDAHLPEHSELRDSTNETLPFDPKVDPEAATELEPPDAAPLEGYELVASLMRRQDEVLEQIDQLDKQIMAMINQITAERDAEKAAENALLESNAAENESENSEMQKTQGTAKDPTSVRRAA